ncbi:MAG TPA: NAD-dependent epimerase/dehydratase family protein, partial [Bacillota bacterium]
MIAGNPSILKRGKSMNVVTGATGHIGNTLVRALLSRDAKVRCLVLPSEGREPLAGLDIETAMGDVRDSGSLEAAFAGADVVYHLASVITLSPRQGRLLKAVNVGGAANVVEACRRTGVRRLVYVSSIHAIAEPPQGTVIDETMPIDPSRIHMAYGKSKAEATRIVLRAAGQGLDAVVVCPTGVIGPYDFRLSEMGRLFLTFAKRRLPAFVDGAYDFVDVRDVAEGLIAAADKGRTGEVYILSGELVTVRRLMGLLGGVTGTRAPRFLAPAW